MLVLLSCTGGEDDLAGTWTGNLTDSLAGVGLLTLTIMQTGEQLTGTWQSTFADARQNNGGSLSGTVTDDSTALVLSAAQPEACSFTVAVARDPRDDAHLTGRYSAFNCGQTRSGSIDVRR